MHSLDYEVEDGSIIMHKLVECITSYLKKHVSCCEGSRAAILMETTQLQAI